VMRVHVCVCVCTMFPAPQVPSYKKVLSLSIFWPHEEQQDRQHGPIAPYILTKAITQLCPFFCYLWHNEDLPQAQSSLKTQPAMRR